MNTGDFVRSLPDGLNSQHRRHSGLRRMHLDGPLMLGLLALCVVGMFVLYSASGKSETIISRQASFFVAGFLAMFLVAQFDLRFMRRWSAVLYVLGLVLLLAVMFYGVGAKGAVRWLEIGPLPRFQPSEVMKLALPLTLAAYLARSALPPKFFHVFFCTLLIAIPTVFIAGQPDLGTAILIATSGLLVLFFAGLSWWYIGGVLALIGVSSPLIWTYVLHEYQKSRILTLLDPEADKLGAGWNIIQSKTAIGSGGIEGKGWLRGTQSQLDFLPEGHTDFIIAVLAEELGLVGVLILVTIYLLIIARCMVIALRAQDNFSRLVVGSITLTFFVYVLVNMGMVSGLLPVVGVPLPFISQGGTSIITLLAGFGVIMAVSTDSKRIAR